MTEKNITQMKKMAAEKAVEFIKSGMVVGLGEGSTAVYAIIEIGNKIKNGELVNIKGIPCSLNVEKVAEESGIQVSDINLHTSIDITIDGADEVDSKLNLIKGGGGALLREKMVAQITDREIIVVDESKISVNLGEKWHVPIEVLQHGWKTHHSFLQNLGGIANLRLNTTGSPFLTDQNNYILDVAFGEISHPEKLENQLNQRTGIVANGLFINLANDVIVSGAEGINHLQK
jgi:ribose 5-phosphate isomerase A